MSRHTARARSGQNRPGLYQEITDKIVAEVRKDGEPTLLRCVVPPNRLQVLRS